MIKFSHKDLLYDNGVSLSYTLHDNDTGEQFGYVRFDVDPNVTITHLVLSRFEKKYVAMLYNELSIVGAELRSLFGDEHLIFYTPKPKLVNVLSRGTAKVIGQHEGNYIMYVGIP